jgi:hypothetical protein
MGDPKESLWKRLEAPATVISAAILVVGVVVRSVPGAHQAGNVLIGVGLVLLALLMVWWRFLVIRPAERQAAAALGMATEVGKRVASLERRQRLEDITRPKVEEPKTLYDRLARHKKKGDDLKQRIRWQRSGRSMDFFEWQISVRSDIANKSPEYLRQADELFKSNYQDEEKAVEDWQALLDEIMKDPKHR